jgi:hypothetical protein
MGRKEFFPCSPWKKPVGDALIPPPASKSR